MLKVKTGRAEIDKGGKNGKTGGRNWPKLKTKRLEWGELQYGVTAKRGKMVKLENGKMIKPEGGENGKNVIADWAEN